MDAIKVDREILGGTPCFAGTRVPVKSLFDYLEDGHNIDYFLGQFPAVKREQVLSVLESSRQRTEAQAKSMAS
ncbi:MAG: DUF433 domain-containing protein [Tepidisphaeraceae bacterium]|jgi:uncharacterized protein (DUF433 family)